MSLSMREVKSTKTYIEDFSAEKGFEDIITVEHRSSNPKRDYLFVNKLQCKHIPCSPSDMIDMCSKLADKVINSIDVYLDSVLVVGFAETATAIGSIVGSKLLGKCYITHTTREDVDNSIELIRFEEEHSHATTQKLLTYRDKSLNIEDYNYILFVEDEISTGNTILNFIDAFESQHNTNEDGTRKKKIKYAVASICNWQNDENKKKFKDRNIQTFCLISGKLKDVNSKMNVQTSNILESSSTKLSMMFSDMYNIMMENCNIQAIKSDITFLKERLGHKKEDAVKTEDVLTKIFNFMGDNRGINSIRIIGTEEFMELPIRVGAILEKTYNYNVVCHATTRSKIDVLNSKFDGTKDGIKSRIELSSAYDNHRHTYLYNTDEKVDLTIVLSDTHNKLALHDFITDLYFKTREYSDKYLIITV